MTTTAPEVTTTDLAATAIREAMVAALKFVLVATSKRPAIAVLSGVLIEGHGDHLTMSAFDYEVSARERVAGTGTGRALVPGHMLHDLLKDGERNGVVDLTMDGEHLRVVTDGTTYKLRTLPLRDYPSLPAPGTVPIAVLTADVVSRLPEVTHAASKDDTLPILTGVRFDNTGPTLQLAATDRYRLAVLETKTTGQRSALVPASTMALLAKHMVGDVIMTGSAIDNDPALPHTPPRVTFIDSLGRILTSTELEGEFPRYRSLVPTGFAGAVTVDGTALTKAIKQVAKVAERNAPVTLNVERTQLEVSAGSDDTATAHKSLPCDTSGEEIRIGFNPGYLLDALNAADKGVTVQYTLPDKPAVFTSPAHEGLRVLLMPVRVGA